MDPAIRIEGLWKEYVLGGPSRPSTLYESLSGAIRAPFRRFRELAGRDRDRERFWALRDLTLDVPEGEVLGVIGRNGAGKSTLLKILTRITAPTRGRVTIRGRVASLLEVGTGFHPELTGRENIYLNGAILGMTRREISARFDEIVAFAEVEKFLDTPVKRYSSGMYVRLAFSVAAHLEPDVLLVDEVLAVGDTRFQQRCLARMGEVRKDGRTILFVSHNLSAIQALCDRALLLDRGRVRQVGEPPEVVQEYLSEQSLESELTAISPVAESGSAEVRLHSICARSNSEARTTFSRLEEIEIEVEYTNLITNSHLNLTLQIRDEESNVAFATSSHTDRNWHGKAFPTGVFRSSCRIPPNLLNSRTYRVELLVVRDQSRVLLQIPDALVLFISDVPEEGLHWHGKWPGSTRPNLPWSTSLTEQIGSVEHQGRPADVPGTEELPSRRQS